MNDYFEQFVLCHDTMDRVCDELRDEMSDTSGRITELVENYKGIIAPLAGI